MSAYHQQQDVRQLLLVYAVCMVTGLPIFSLIDLSFFYQLECIRTLNWERVCRSFFINVTSFTPIIHNIFISILYTFLGGRDSSVGTATRYVLDGPGMESRWGARFSAPVQTGPEAYPASCTMGTGSFPGVMCGQGVTLTPHPLLVQKSKIE